jgi:hypothetical protein
VLDSVGVAPLASVACLACVALLLAGCGGKTTTTTTNSAGRTVVTCHIPLAKTKFLLHTGLAFAAFHRYIEQPWRAGAFESGAPGRTKALVKAGASALVVFHELQIAYQDAHCDGPVLAKLAAPVASASAVFQSMKTALAHGDLSGIAQGSSLLATLSSEAAKAGLTIG